MSLLKNSILYTVGKILPQAAGFLLLPLYTNYLTPEEYGLVESMMILSMVLSIFFSMATERSMFRLFFDFDSKNGQQRFIWNTFFLILLFSVIVFALLFLFSGTVEKLFEGIPFNPYFEYAIFYGFLMAISFLPQTLYQVRQQAIKFLILNLSIFFIGIGFILYFLIYKEEGALGLIKGRFYGLLLLLPVNLYIIFKNSIFKIDLEICRKILSFSLPMIPTLLSSWLLNMSNRIFIEHYFTLKEVGLYSFAFKISGIATIVLGGLFTAYNPYFYKLANSNDQEGAKKEIIRSARLIGFFVLIICSGITFVGKEIIILFFDNSYSEALGVFPIIMLSVFIIQIGALYNLMIYQQKKTVFIMNISIAGSILSIALNFILVKQYGMYGAAWASVLVVLIMFLFKHLYAKKCYYFDFSLGKIFLYLILVILFVLFFDFYLKLEIWHSLLLKVILVTFGGIFIYLKNKSFFHSLLK